MLGDKNATATVAVRDIDAARKFYEGTLGLARLDAEGSEAVVYAAGASRLLVYRSQFAGTNQATAVTWTLGQDLERAVDLLKSKGVAFEHYEMPEARLEGDVHIMGDMRAAWFKDPDGNIHALVSR